MSSDFLRALGEAAVKAAVDAAIQYAIGELTRSDPTRPETFVTIKQTVPVRHFAYGRGRKAGAFAFWESANGHTLDVIAFCHGRIAGNWQFWFHDDQIALLPDGETQQGENGRYGGPVHVYHREGLPTETYYPEVAAKSGVWTSSHRGDHTASAAVVCQMVSSEKMPRIYPNGQVETSAAADWLCVYDWRDPTQSRTDPATWKWSDNPIICWVHDEWARNAAYWGHPTRGPLERSLADRIWTRRFLPTLDILKEEADACDEIVGGSKRYTAFVWYMADTDRKSVREMFRRACDGWMVERGDGAYILRCGRWLVNPSPIDDSMLVEVSLRAGIAKSELINELQIRFTSWDHNHEIVDTTPWTDEASIAKRGRKTDVLELPEVNTNGQARRVGKSAFSALNAQHRGSLTIDLDRAPDSLFDYRFQRLQSVEGSSAFRDMVVEFGRPEINLLERTITVDFRSANPARYDWDAATEEGPGPAGTVRPPTEGTPVPALIGDPIFSDNAIRFTLDGPLPSEGLTPVIRWWPSNNPAAVTTMESALYAGPDDDFYIYSGSIIGFPATVDGLTAQVAYRNAAGTLGPYSDEFLITVS